MPSVYKELLLLKFNYTCNFKIKKIKKIKIIILIDSVYYYMN